MSPGSDLPGGHTQSRVTRPAGRRRDLRFTFRAAPGAGPSDQEQARDAGGGSREGRQGGSNTWGLSWASRVGAPSHQELLTFTGDVWGVTFQNLPTASTLASVGMPATRADGAVTLSWDPAQTGASGSLRPAVTCALPASSYKTAGDARRKNRGGERCTRGVSGEMRGRLASTTAGPRGAGPSERVLRRLREDFTEALQRDKESHIRVEKAEQGAPRALERWLWGQLDQRLSQGKPEALPRPEAGDRKRFRPGGSWEIGGRS